MNQNLTIPSKIRAEHLNRKALVYVRQSTMAQVRFNQESTQRQYALRERALSLGWPEEHIRIIDGDLGISGSGRSKRPGFAQLVTSVSLGEVGAVFGLEISRLARSSADLMKLLELCGLFGTLVIDEDGIYDMSDFNDRLLIGLKGTMGEAELHFLHARMIGGKENAASRGELRFPLPVGYIYDPDGRTIMDPNEEIRHAVATLFKAFRITGSAYGVVRYFAENNLSFPKRAYGGAWDGKITWGTLTHSRVLAVIHNPSYAGAYVYGRYRDNKTVDADGHFEHHPVRLPDKNDWKVFLPDHHPAYITWEEFEENQNRLGSNRTNTERCGPAREGAALLTGILICGKCGRRMTVRYTGTGGIRPLYECVGRWEHGNKATCSSVPAETLDHAVSEKILSIMEPSELEISLKVSAASMIQTGCLKSNGSSRSNAHSMKLTAQNGSLCSPIQKTGWLSVLWNPTGTRNSKNWKKQNRIMPYTIPKKPGSPPKKKNRTFWISHKRFRRSGTHQHLRQKKRSGLSAS